MSSAIKRHARRSRDEWQQLLDAQRGSALSEAAFCERHDIGLVTYRNWKRRLGKARPTDGWLEIDPLPAPASAVSSWDIELELGHGICLRLRRSTC